MRRFIRQSFQNILPKLSAKSQWTRNDEELEELLYRYVSIGQSTMGETKVFLSKQNIPFQQEAAPFQRFSAFSDNQTNVDYIIFFTLSGPTLWDGLVPFGSKYDIAFLFKDSILVSTEIHLMEFHF